MQTTFHWSMARLRKGGRMAVSKRGSKWHYAFMIDGVRYRGSIKTARTKAQAELAELQIKQSVHEGKYSKPRGRITMKEFIDQRYVPWAQANKRSWRIDQSRLKPIVQFFGKRQIGEITPFQIEQFKIARKNAPSVWKTKTGERREKPRSVGAVNREFRLLSRILRLAVDSGDLAENPCRRVRILKGEQHRTRYLLPDEEERLMTVLEDMRSPLRNMVILAINSGLRVSEILKLKIEHVDFHRDVLYIKGTKTDEDREVPLNDVTRQLLTKLVMRAQGQGDDYVFTNPRTSTRYLTMKTAWHSACRQAGIRDLRFHDLRHTFGTRAADAGVPLNAIRDVMGHKSTAMTERYAHATDEGKRKAVEALQPARGGKTEKDCHNFATIGQEQEEG
ncbi:MAG: tyrosine-type recombinase/integrase, partial [Blastocatellia bacterium]